MCIRNQTIGWIFNSLRTEVSLLKIFCLLKVTDFLKFFLYKHNEVVRDYSPSEYDKVTSRLQNGTGKITLLADSNSDGIMDKRTVFTEGLTFAQYYFEMAKKLEMHYLVCEPEKDQWDMLDSLGRLYQIKIAIHEYAKGKSIYWHPDSVLAAIKGHPNFGACADKGHWVRSGLDPVGCLKKLDGHVIDVHLKDLDESNNINANNVMVGKGVIDFPAVANELKRQQFRGNVMLSVSMTGKVICQM